MVPHCISTTICKYEIRQSGWRVRVSLFVTSTVASALAPNPQPRQGRAGQEEGAGGGCTPAARANGTSAQGPRRCGAPA